MEQQSTLEELKLLFEILGPLKSSKESFDAAHSEIIFDILTLGEIVLNKCEVRKSPIHGRGVFAKNKIDEGELITLYPAHYLTLNPEGPSIGGYGRIGLLESELARSRNVVLPDNMRTRYSLSVNKYYGVCGHPEISDNSAFLGHMVNDGAKGHSTKENYNPTDETLYTKISNSLRNAKFEYVGGFCYAIVATKPINVDEEIIVPYGYGYWTSNNSY